MRAYCNYKELELGDTLIAASGRKLLVTCLEEDGGEAAVVGCDEVLPLMTYGTFLRQGEET